MKFCRNVAMLSALLSGVALSALGQELAVPNGSFEEADGGRPLHWTLVNGQGRLISEEPGDGAQSALIEGDPETTSYWKSQPVPLRPRSLYALHYKVKRIGEGGGPPVAGPVFSNYVLYSTDIGRWNDRTLVFQTPDDLTPEGSWLRFGQARMNTGSIVAFDAVQILPVQAVHARSGDIVLGDGEQIDGKHYMSAPRWSTALSNQYRPLFGFKKTVYNHNAFLMGDGSEVSFRYAVGSRQQLSAILSLNPMYYFNGALVVEASTDGNEWRTIQRIAGDKGVQISLPPDLFPAREIWVRMRCEADEPVGIDFELGSLGLGTFRYEAELDGDPVDFRGSTRFVEILDNDPGVPVTVTSTGDLAPFGDNVCELSVENPLPREMALEIQAAVKRNGEAVYRNQVSAILPASKTSHVAVPYEISTYGEHSLSVHVEEGPGFAARVNTYVSPLYASGYGQSLPDSSDDASLWWASPAWKVARNIPAPKKRSKAARIALARNEAEAIQIVIRPEMDLKGFTAEASDLEGPGGVIPAESIDVLRVGYVDVTMPSDRRGAVAPWPEPLPPFHGPVDLKAGQNQPLWVRVKAPTDASPGVYCGEIRLSADGYEAVAPLKVEVYDFTLPGQMTMNTAFGASENVVSQYHRLRTQEDRRAVWEMYLQALADYHLSPYDPAPFERIRVEWLAPGTAPEEMSAELDWTNWAAEMERVLNKYAFTSFRFPMPGLTGKKYPNHRREIDGFQGDTPEFKALFDSYAGQVEDLFREKGWLDKAFVYWFDEPHDKDIPFVQSGFQLLKDGAPDLRRMIATNSGRYLPELEGYINVWCPQVNAVPISFVEDRVAAGDELWWYLCTNPKEPYPCIFIDHPGVNMRVWPWMSWGYSVQGLLVWSTTRWHSRAAYPEGLQNPYTDPMTWQGDAGPGVRNPYGNGDGVFLYPPEQVFDDSIKGPVLKPPVGSQRGELLRDGIEDYEYFVILRGLLEEKGEELSRRKRAAYVALLTPPEEVYVDRRTYSFDPAPLEEHRDKLARAIADLISR